MPFNELEREECRRILHWGLVEDLGPAGDITSKAVIPPALRASALFVTRVEGVVAGLPMLPMLVEAQDGDLELELLLADGPVPAETAVARLCGPLLGILAVERLALNVLGQLSGTATLTARYVAAVAGTNARICDTRKTTPGWRHLEKYAVRVGGGTNHRIGLFDAVLIKDNHLAGLGAENDHPIAVAIERVRATIATGTVVEVEVDSLRQLEEALAAGPDIVLLDNMSPQSLRLAVEIRDRKAPTTLLEASGGITLENVARVAQAGVDRISIGALTHSAPALDLGLDYEASQS